MLKLRQEIKKEGNPTDSKETNKDWEKIKVYKQIIIEHRKQKGRWNANSEKRRREIDNENKK